MSRNKIHNSQIYLARFQSKYGNKNCFIAQTSFTFEKNKNYNKWKQHILDLETWTTKSFSESRGITFKRLLSYNEAETGHEI